MRFKSVDLPIPYSPTSATNSPPPIENVIDSKTRRCCGPPNVLLRLATESTDRGYRAGANDATSRLTGIRSVRGFRHRFAHRPHFAHDVGQRMHDRAILTFEQMDELKRRFVARSGPQTDAVGRRRLEPAASQTHRNAEPCRRVG